MKLFNFLNKGQKIKEKHIEMAIKIMQEHDASMPENHHISPSYLHFKGYPKEINASETMKILRSLGFVDYRKFTRPYEEDYVLTDKGKSYFIDKEQERSREKRAFRHDWLVAIFSALSGAFLSKPLWEIIDLLCRFLFDKPTP